MATNGPKQFQVLTPAAAAPPYPTSLKGNACFPRTHCGRLFPDWFHDRFAAALHIAISGEIDLAIFCLSYFIYFRSQKHTGAIWRAPSADWSSLTGFPFVPTLHSSSAFYVLDLETAWTYDRTLRLVDAFCKRCHKDRLVTIAAAVAYREELRGL